LFLQRPKIKKEAAEMRSRLERDRPTVAFVQDMESLREGGIAQLVDVYVAGYGLSQNRIFSLCLEMKE
jgi:hypothetical protein